jgi:hypothetical protein
MKLAIALHIFVLAASVRHEVVDAFSLRHASASRQRATTTSLSLAASTDSQDPKRRVVVTGLGVVSGCGIGHESFFEALLQGKSSIDKVRRFDISAYPCQIGSEVPDDMFDPTDFFVNPKNIKSNDRFTHFAVAAARQALKDGNMGDTPDTLLNPDRIGVMVGTAFGGMETFERETLKLAAKPERPKVLDISLLLFRVDQFVRHPRHSQSRFVVTGLSLHDPSTSSKHCLRSYWY